VTILRRVSLDSIWSDVKRLTSITERVNKRYAAFFKEEEDVSYTHRLISPYKVEDLVEEAKRYLVDLAIRLTFEKHSVNNVSVGKGVVEDLAEGEFDEGKIVAYIEENYVKRADEIAYWEILIAARALVPRFWGEHGFRKTTVEDLVKGRRLILRVTWWRDLGILTHYSDQSIAALDKLIAVVLGGEKPSRARALEVSIHHTLSMWRGDSQARKYILETDYIKSFRVYKNGKFEIEFKREEYARKVAEALIEA